MDTVSMEYHLNSYHLLISLHRKFSATTVLYQKVAATDDGNINVVSTKHLYFSVSHSQTDALIPYHYDYFR